ncbi:hypothetical protein [Plastoroseomonas arctica]|uniref:Uncharacterized protein n=1 Tax=Plastoroseomonas arctica TaxID=1509237 RepID=A0AAF1K358_9PROT|nr:hypothetical protein [Plastoroseomonas arctica]MBR0655551.1 hypothetical protein [Plastoroseomonas arctica]
MLGLRQSIPWAEGLETMLFAEAVQFQSAGGVPVEVIDAIPGAPARAIAERRRFTTLAAQTTYGDWRATIAWQQDERKRSGNTLATERFLEVTGGRVLGAGFTLDAGWQFATLARDNGTGTRGQGPIALLRYRAEF